MAADDVASRVAAFLPALRASRVSVLALRADAPPTVRFSNDHGAGTEFRVAVQMFGDALKVYVGCRSPHGFVLNEDDVFEHFGASAAWAGLQQGKRPVTASIVVGGGSRGLMDRPLDRSEAHVVNAIDLTIYPSDDWEQLARRIAAFLRPYVYPAEHRAEVARYAPLRGMAALLAMSVPRPVPSLSPAARERMSERERIAHGLLEMLNHPHARGSLGRGASGDLRLGPVTGGRRGAQRRRVLPRG